MTSRSSSRRSIVKSKVDARTSASASTAGARPATPPATTGNGITPGSARFDTPPAGSQVSATTSGRRQCRSTERGDYYARARRRSNTTRDKGNRTRKHNAELRARIEQRDQLQDASGTANQDRGARPDPSATTDSGPANPGAIANPGPTGPAPEARARGRPRSRRQISRSPTPGSTDCEIEATQPPTLSVNSQYTYIWETLDHNGLVKYAEEKLGEHVGNCSTQEILQKLGFANSQEQAPQVGLARQQASIDFLPPTPITMKGGGYHRDFPTHSQMTASQASKRRSDASDEQAAKRQRTAAPDDDTATESETDIYESLYDRAARNAAEDLFPHPTVPDPLRPGPPPQPFPHPGTQPPPPSPASTPTTIPQTQPSPRTTRLSQYGASIPPLPNLTTPIRGPVHARLRAEVLQRFFDEADAAANTADAQAAAQARADADGMEDMDGLGDSNSVQGNAPHHHPTNANTSQRGLHGTGQWTYSGLRTHATFAPSEPDPAEEAAEPPIRPNSPSLTPRQLIIRERARAMAEKVREEVTGRSCIRPRPLVASASQPPTNQPQARMPPGVSSSVPGSSRKPPGRRLDPVSAARADMINFNKACANNEATNFVESATRRNKRNAGCQAVPRPSSELLPDNEELLAHAEAATKSRLPNPPTNGGGNRKKKPCARDYSGLVRQILTLAKMHLFAYALAEGIYQTRATFLQWAAAVHEATWNMELPDTPYTAATMEELEVMVNYIATLRGKVKERLRPVVVLLHAFQQRITNQQIIQENQNTYNLLCPNNFHCKTYCPRAGHFESPDIGHAISAALFQGPTSVGVLFPDYFADMPLPVVAFILAIWKFDIEEWSNGWHENRDLGAGHMLDTYEGFLAGLKDLAAIAPKRMARLQKSWRDYAEEYSGASFRREETTQYSALRSELRPDTPPPDNNDNDFELDIQMMEAAREQSMRQLEIDLAARGELHSRAETPVADNESHTQASRSPTPPPLEYNEHGNLTARAKGKGRAD